MVYAEEMGDEEYFGEEEYQVEGGEEQIEGSGAQEGEEEEPAECPSPTRTEMDQKEELRRKNEMEITNRFIHSTLLENINESRQKAGCSAFYENLGLVNVAQNYAHYFASDRGDEATPNPALAYPKAKDAGYKEEP